MTRTAKADARAPVPYPVAMDTEPRDRGDRWR